jgi:hypothetical protein
MAHMCPKLRKGPASLDLAELADFEARMPVMGLSGYPERVLVVAGLL